MKDAAQLQALGEMTPEQLDFNKKMLAFFKFLGMSEEQIALLPKVVEQWDGLVSDCNRNFQTLASRLSSDEEEINKLKQDEASGSPDSAKKTVMEELSEKPKGLNPYGE